MTINDLINLLQEQANEYGGDTEVVIVHQENYPIRERVLGVAPPVTMTDEDYEDIEAHNPGIDREEAEGIFFDDTGDAANEVTIVAGGHPNEGSPYGDRSVWERAVR